MPHNPKSCPPSSGRDDMLTPAKTWEANGDYNRAIEAYLKMTIMQSTDYSLLEEVHTMNRPNQELLFPDWLITSHVT